VRARSEAVNPNLLRPGAAAGDRSGGRVARSGRSDREVGAVHVGITEGGRGAAFSANGSGTVRQHCSRRAIAGSRAGTIGDMVSDGGAHRTSPRGCRRAASENHLTVAVAHG